MSLILAVAIGFAKDLSLPQKCIHFDADTQALNSDGPPLPRHCKIVRPAPPAPRRADRCGERPTRRVTERIVESITTAIVERRLMPGTKLAEQKIADIFKVSRTLVRQALNQLSRDKLVTLEPARGARVAEPSVEEARQVFEVRQMLETAMIRRARRRAHAGADGRAARAPAPTSSAAVQPHRRLGPHAPARRLPCRARAHARQRGAGRACSASCCRAAR